MTRAMSIWSCAALLLLAAGAVQSQTIYMNPDNGHYYIYINSSASYISWSAADISAKAIVFFGVNGHLATITSESENSFLVSSLPNWPSVTSYWIGGFQNPTNMGANYGWQWVTSEVWSYTNWTVGEPNDSAGTNEDGLEWRAYEAQRGQWNDYMRTSGRGEPGYIVEFEPVPEPSSILTLLGGISALSLRRRK